jgi:hypothetical protein
MRVMFVCSSDKVCKKAHATGSNACISVLLLRVFYPQITLFSLITFP